MLTTGFLLNATLVIAALVVLALVVYLTAILVALIRAGNHLKALAGGLQQIANDTDPLAGKLATINGALGELETGLRGVDGKLVGIAKVLRLA